MKKILVLLVISLTFTLLSGCKDSQDPSFIGKIESINNDSALVLVQEGEEIQSSGDKVNIDISKYNGELNINDKIKVIYTGEVMESYPLQVTVVSIEKIK